MVDIAGANVGRNPKYLTPMAQNNKTQSQKDAKSYQQNFASNSLYSSAQPQKFGEIISKYNAVVSQNKQDEEKKKASNHDSNPTSNKPAKDAILASIFSSDVTPAPKAEEKKQDSKHKPVVPEKTFNILSMFKPGEILNTVAKNDKDFSFMPNQNLSFIS